MIRVVSAIESLLFPEICVHCDTAFGEDGHCGLCNACAGALAFFPPAACPLCGRPSKNRASCRACRQFPPSWRKLAVLGWYEGPLASLIRAGKIANRHQVIDHIVSPMIEKIDGTYDAVVAVPSDHRFVRILADRIADELGVPRLEPIYRVVGATRQVGLRRAARRLNARKALNRRDCSVPQSVILIDDILTTGATIHVGASLLREAGALVVDAAAIARAPLGGRS